MKHFDWKTLFPYLVALVLFVGFAVFYCSPLTNGKVLYAGDVNNWKGSAQEAREFNKAEGTTTFWTNSMFGGMPTYQITGSTPANKFRAKIETLTRLGFSNDWECAGLIIAYLIGFFLMLRCFGVNRWLSIIGAFALALSTYFFIILPAGHITKAKAIGCLAPMIGGFYAIFRKNYWLGGPLVLIYGIIGITFHPQMTYYTCMLLGIMAIAELYIHIREKRFKDLGIGIGILLVCFGLIFLTKLSWWGMNREYLAETMRGGHSELTTQEEQAKPAGLDIDYATAWSYGKAETLTLLVPNYMGGASGYNLGDDSELYKDLVKARVQKGQAKQFCQHAPTYWGEKAFTSGAVYVGAIICFLFILGLIIVPGAYKWALLAATIFSILLAWGHNFMALTQFFYDYFPMYNKFRAVESILVVAEITIPLLGFLALQRIVSAPGEERQHYARPILIAGGITAGICLLVALFGAGHPISSYDASWKGQVGDEIYSMILSQRTAMAHADAWRSLIFVLLGAGLLWLYTYDAKKRFSPYVLYTILGILILADLVPVNRRFFNKDNFVSRKEADRAFAIQPWEEQILQDESLDFRVFNVAANTFNDSRTSYRLKSIGGYHAAKLRRYQDLIDAHISRQNWQVLNMLNTKYIITQQGVFPNHDAFGNAWMVDTLVCVADPNAESDALHTLNLRTTAVCDTTLAANRNLASWQLTPNESSSANRITMTSYAPNRLEYEADASAERLTVFSEIYYPHGWHLYIDGEQSPLYRVNYTLRAALIPAGHHTIVMEFIPDALRVDKWCMLVIILSILLSLGSIGYYCYKQRECE